MRHYHPGIAPYIQDTRWFNNNRYYGMLHDPRRRLPRAKTLGEVERVLVKVIAWEKNRRDRINAVVDAIFTDGKKPDTSTGGRLAHVFPHQHQEQFREDPRDKDRWWVYIVSESEYLPGAPCYQFKWVVKPIKPFRPELGKQLYDLEQQASTRVHLVKERFKELLESWVEHHFPVEQSYSEPSLSVEVNGREYFVKVDKDPITGRLVKVEWLYYAVHHRLAYAEAG
jgi:hypothetical protein